MDTCDDILCQIEQRLPSHHALENKDRKSLRKTIDACMEASISTEEGVFVRFSLLWDPGSEFPFKKRYSPDDIFQPSFGLKHSAPLKRIVKLAQASKPGISFLVVQATEQMEEPQIVGVTKLHKFFGAHSFDWVRDRLSQAHPSEQERVKRVIAITCLGPLHFIIQNETEELAYVRKGRIEGEIWDNFAAVENAYKIGPRPTEVPKDNQAGLAVLNNIVRGMWHAGRGGTLALCAPGKDPSLLEKSGDELQPPIEPKPLHRAWLASVADTNNETMYKSCISDIVRLSGIDGALVLDHNVQVLRFGFKLQADLKRKLDCQLIRPNCDPEPDKKLTYQGTRHRSAAYWAHQREGRIAIVVSQDREVSIFTNNADGKLIRLPYRHKLFS